LGGCDISAIKPPRGDNRSALKMLEASEKQFAEGKWTIKIQRFMFGESHAVKE
jgi:hypothetical protein